MSKVYSVSELTREIKALLEGQWSEIAVEGEISNFRVSQAGHLYFSLKDDQALLRVVLFRQAAIRLPFRPADGLQVFAFGRLSVYEPRGDYQLICERLEPKGVGALEIAFQQLKEKLALEGLFAEARKRSLPLLPQKIGIVTSPTGAALQDIIQVLTRRFPNIQILIAPVLVQGEEAAPEIVSALQALNREDLDLIILGRGGGSLEDLWVFNDERVVRAIFSSRHPVISAVGHETDYTLADFVADVRASTPSAAAELAVPVKEELVFRVEDYRRKLRQRVLEKIEKGRLQLNQWRAYLGDPRRRLERYWLGFDALLFRLKALSPQAVLDRGYALVTGPGGRLLKNSAEVEVGDPVKIRLARGSLQARVAERLK